MDHNTNMSVAVLFFIKQELQVLLSRLQKHFVDLPGRLRFSLRNRRSEIPCM